jgi:glycosyltransferase involved in cell wall biosynthesis
MTGQVRLQTWDLPHWIVTTDGAKCPGMHVIRLEPGDTISLYRQLRQRLRHIRVALAPILITAGPHPLRVAALMYAPTKVLAFNASLQRCPLHPTRPVEAWRLLSGRSIDAGPRHRSWIQALSSEGPDFPEGATVYEGRALSAGRPRIGILTPYFPYPLAHGGAVRMFNLMREAAREFDLFLFSFDDPYTKPDVTPVLEHCSRVVLVRQHPGARGSRSLLTPKEVGEVESRQMRAMLSRIRAEFRLDLMQVEFTHMANYAGDILVEHDVTFHLHDQVREEAPDIQNSFNYQRWKRFEREAVKRFRRVVFMSEEEALLLDCGARARTIANGVDLERYHPMEETPGAHIFFVGSFRHFPNVWAYRRLVKEVFPRVKAHLPHATATVVAGQNHVLYWRSFANSIAPPSANGIEMLEYVADLRPLYARANVVIVPNAVSAGTNIKALEAMAMKRAIVGTSRGCAGLGLKHMESAWIADDSDGLAEGIITLLRDPALRCRMAANARSLAERDFDWRAIGARLRSMYDELLEERRCGT